MSRFCSVVLVSVLAGAGGAGASAQANAAPDREVIGPWHAVESDGVSEARRGDPAFALDAVRFQLAAGRPELALDILQTGPIPDSPEVVELTAIARYALGEFVVTAELLESLANRVTGLDRGAALARAGLAREQAGQLEAAHTHYVEAATLLPAIAGWLELRAAATSLDPAAGLRLLARAPAAAQARAGELEAGLHLARGDTVRAVDVLTRISRHGWAARLSHEAGYEALARELAYAAMGDRGSDAARDAAALAFDHYRPTNAREAELLSRALSRHDRDPDAVEVMSAWVRAGDSSASTLLAFGQLLEGASRRPAALAAYDAAARGRDRVAGEAEYRRIRLSVRMGRHAGSIEPLRDFGRQFPGHRRVAWATYLLGDLLWDAASRPTSDSAFNALIEQWPDSYYASLARYRLAARALLARDTSLAIERFRAAADAGGDQANSSRYQLGILLRAHGDEAGAREEWLRLAHEDSLGYYGLIARRETDLPAPRFAPVEAASPSGPIATALAELAWLERVGLDEEAESLVDYLVSSEDFTADQRLEIAEGLVAADRTVRGIRLGWELTRDFTLNHPRVLRVIFPYTNRTLVETESRKFGLDPFLVAGMIRQESAFDAEAVSRAGARGLMQLMPATARWQARSQGIEWHNGLLTVADANVHVGTSHLAALMRQYDGRLERVLAAYNAGGGAVRRWLRYPEAGDPIRWVERIPYTETRGYVKTVLRNQELYRALYGESPIS